MIAVVEVVRNILCPTSLVKRILLSGGSGGGG